MSDEIHETQGSKDEEKRYTKKPNKPIKRKICTFCIEKNVYIDYKDINRLKKYVTEKGKIIPRRQSGLCAKHQRELTQAVKRARTMFLI